MKVLWFSPTPALYKNTTSHPYFGGGWIASIQKIVETDINIELAIAFFHSDKVFKVKQGATIYYPIALREGKLNKIKNNLYLNRSDRKEVDYFHQIINDFNPDLIQVFGSERSFGLVCKSVKVPIVIHVQGLINPYFNSYFIPGMSKLDFLLRNDTGILRIIYNFHTLRLWKHACNREKLILSSCKYFLGRTNWDKALTSLYSPDSTYFYCSEILREVFYQNTWGKNRDKQFIIATTISKVSYKGFDLVLKTAKLLKEFTGIDFEWRVFGINSYRFMENETKISAKSVNIKYCGVLSSSKLCDELLDADVFINTSYIDNSPNSVCEAQILGMPVISTNVGGISSLIENEKTGYLVPANDPYFLAAKIIEIAQDKELCLSISGNSRSRALIRHNPDNIIADLISIYNTVVNEKK